MKKKHAQRKKSRVPVTRADIGPLKRLVVDSGKVGRRNKRKHSHAIGYIHELNKQVEAARSTGDVEKEEKLQDELKQLGGLAVYQSFSRKSEDLSGFNTSRWVVEQLIAVGMRPKVSAQSENAGKQLRLLDVGALERNFRRERRWIDAKAIDLHPQSEHIEQMDFLEYPDVEQGTFDVVCLW